MYYHFSTVSSTLNSIAAVILQDFIRPYKPSLSDKNATIITKGVSIALGAVAILLVLFARYFGSGVLSVSKLFITCKLNLSRGMLISRGKAAKIF